MKEHCNSDWPKNAQKLQGLIGIDYRNQQLYADPWKAWTKSMVCGWRNIQSQGRLSGRPLEKTMPQCWEQAAKKAKASIDSRHRSRLLDKTTWSYWANHLPQFNLRYIRKDQRA